ncbi:MAG: TIGR03013 family XrtA/PEP-CTERM system glycosyltransferase [Pseudomonadota bacterium]
MAWTWAHSKYKNLFLLEMLFFVLAATAAFLLRFYLSTWDVRAYPYLVPKMILAVFMTQLSLYYNGLYEFGVVRRAHNLVLTLLQAFAGATLSLLALYYAFPFLLIGRGVFFLMMSLFFVVAILFRSVLHLLFLRGYLAQRVLVLGSGKGAVSIIKYLNDPNPHSYKLVGFLKEDLVHLGPFQALGAAVGSYGELFATALREQVQMIVVALDDRRGRLPLGDLVECKLRGIEVMDSARFWEVERGIISVPDLPPSWLIFSDGFRQSTVTLVLKGISEFLIALTALIVLAPFALLAAAAIRIDSPGPILYRQLRVGARGGAFTLLKFRSMRADAEGDGAAQWAAEEDPRVTRAGRFLRKYRLDEIPQLINVIRGEMSLVGPRPERPEFVNELIKKVPCYAQRLAVKPGVTGLAQVRMKYAASVEDAAEKLKYDLFYVKNVSFILDLAILVDTFKVVLLGKGAR